MQLRDTTLKALFRALLTTAFRVEVAGLEHWRETGDRLLIVANHVSLLDALLLAAFLPGKPTFAVNTHMARKWWVRPFLHMVDFFPMDPMNPMSVRAMTRAVEQGRHVVVFPEGRITVTGALMKVYDGPGMIADKARAQVLPVRIDGAQYTCFSYLGGKLRRRLFPKITLTLLPPRRLVVKEGLRGRARRHAAGECMFDILSDMMFETADIARTVPQALLDAMAVHGHRHGVVEDLDRKRLDFSTIVVGMLALGRRLAAMTRRGEAVGVLLPNAAGTLVTLLGLQMFGRVPAMLNVTAGSAGLNGACVASGVNLVLTSRRFVEAARLHQVVAALKPRVVYLEDIRQGIGPGRRLWALASLPFARKIHARHHQGPDGAAVILFTSGSEGTPKGVVLSHRNILGNCSQVAARVDFNPSDSVLNALPLFHAFGLTGGTLLPVLWGIKVFLYPSPLHYRMVPEMAYDTGATIMFGTDTFLSGYGRMAHPYDFHSIRYVFAGAEKVRDTTRTQWMEKFGLRLLEGYGATETAPVLAVNTAILYRSGTVGRFLPGLDWRIEPFEGVEEGGRLWVRGPNVMLGYLKTERPGEIQPLADGWYDTGDIVTVEDGGYVRILGRAKRFAKIAGEMVSLAVVEDVAAALWPHSQHAVISIPDPRKGEQLVLVTTEPHAERPRLAQAMRDAGAPELAVPRRIEIRHRLPVLGTGKPDYQALRRDLMG